jgi:hypothetical protein
LLRGFFDLFARAIDVRSCRFVSDFAILTDQLSRANFNAVRRIGSHGETDERRMQKQTNER